MSHRWVDAEKNAYSLSTVPKKVTEFGLAVAAWAPARLRLWLLHGTNWALRFTCIKRRCTPECFPAIVAALSKPCPLQSWKSRPSAAIFDKITSARDWASLASRTMKSTNDYLLPLNCLGFLHNEVSGWTDQCVKCQEYCRTLLQSTSQLWLPNDFCAHVVCHQSYEFILDFQRQVRCCGFIWKANTG